MPVILTSDRLRQADMKSQVSPLCSKKLFQETENKPTMTATNYRTKDKARRKGKNNRKGRDTKNYSPPQLKIIQNVRVQRQRPESIKK